MAALMPRRLSAVKRPADGSVPDLCPQVDRFGVITLSSTMGYPNDRL
ncbi:hypothetical protein [Antarctobacter jejuensis]